MMVGKKGFTKVGVILYIANIAVGWLTGNLVWFLVALGLVIVDVVMEVIRIDEMRFILRWYEVLVPSLILGQFITSIVRLAVMHLS